MSATAAAAPNPAHLPDGHDSLAGVEAGPSLAARRSQPPPRRLGQELADPAIAASHCLKTLDLAVGGARICQPAGPQYQRETGEVEVRKEVGCGGERRERRGWPF